MIDRLDTVCIKVKDVEKSSNWYQEVLGFGVAFEGNGYRVLSVGNGVPLTIEEGLTSMSTNQSYPIFFSKNIEDTYSSLKSQGVQIDPLHNDDVSHFFDFYDLDGNKLQVCYFE
ncbi:VOC family protein [Halobacillus mangrovi]|uniref:VOC domain-containing protein n=1 Tax=Halobacillus mangrovi TaxID=402384 RepID=A0A1W5ZXC2_9BACI|nr:VOC family protein [Halobacillus mangrovi]ARI77913.1 hypothetical protein HM131_14115 [Halobacillus mangrovi]